MRDSVGKNIFVVAINKRIRKSLTLFCEKEKVGLNLTCSFTVYLKWGIKGRAFIT